MTTLQTETIDRDLGDLDLRSNEDIVSCLLASQSNAVTAVEGASVVLASAVGAAAARLRQGSGRLVLAGAGASGRLAVQDGAELWPTFGWPASRLVLEMAGGHKALVHSIEGVEDDADAAVESVKRHAIGADDVVVAVAASGRSPWTCAWLQSSIDAGALGIGLANNAGAPLLDCADHAIHLDSGPEVLAGSTRMAAGTAQKIALNLFSTTLMVRLNRTYGNLMVDMAASNAKLAERRVRLVLGVLPDADPERVRRALEECDGWGKLAVLRVLGDSLDDARARLDRHDGSLRSAMAERSGS